MFICIRLGKHADVRTHDLCHCCQVSTSELRLCRTIHLQLVAGTFSPGIEIWDLDVLDSVEPLTTLGGPVAEGEAAQPTKEEMSAKGKKKKKKKAAKVL